MTLLPVRINKKEPIRLMERRHNYFPKRFMWRGDRYDINSVERTWTKMHRKGARHFFRVHCRQGTFDIYQDTILNAWYLAARIA